MSYYYVTNSAGFRLRFESEVKREEFKLAEEKLYAKFYKRTRDVEGVDEFWAKTPTSKIMEDLYEKHYPKAELNHLKLLTTIIATQLTEAVLNDEEGEGLDISAGMFGEHTSKWIRSVAENVKEVSYESFLAKAKFKNDEVEQNIKLISTLGCIANENGYDCAKSLVDALPVILEKVE